MFEGNSSKSTVSFSLGPLEKRGFDLADQAEAFGPVRWANKKEIRNNPKLVQNMVPVCRREESDDGEVWYIARVSYFVSTTYIVMFGLA